MAIEKIRISDLPITEKENEGYSIVVRGGRTERYRVNQLSQEHFSQKQDKTDDALQTETKSVVGAINEIDAALGVVQRDVLELQDVVSRIDSPIVVGFLGNKEYEDNTSEIILKDLENKMKNNYG